MNKKTKILFTVGSFSVGGKERQLIEIINNLDKDRYEIYLFFKNNNGYYFDLVKDNLKSYYDLNQNKFNFKSFFKLNSYISLIKPDLVICFDKINSYFSFFLSFFYKYKLITSIRNVPIRFSKKASFQKKLYSFFPYIVANSEAGLKAYNQYGKKGRFVLYNGFNFNRIPKISKQKARKKASFDKAKFNGIMVSSLRECYSKDPSTYLKTAKYLQDIYNSIEFYLVGGGIKKEDIQNYIKKNKINNIKLLGTRNDVEALFLAADFSVLISETEGISNSIVESMACGIPVIATSKGGTKELIENKENGFVIESRDYKNIANKIIELKNNKLLYKKLSKNAVKTIKSKFSVEKMIQNFENILKKVEDAKE